MTDVDIPALERIKVRLSGSTASELEGVLPSLIPNLIPLANQDSLRSKVVEILVEATRRSKLFGVKLSLNVFASCVDKSFLPFGCNLAFAFLDSVSDHGCLIDISPVSIARLLDALVGFDIFSYQSNAILYYLITNNEFIPEAISLMTEDKQIALNILSDYYLDFLLYRPSPMVQSGVTNTNTAPKQIHYGLVDNRVHRIAFKQKQFNKLNVRAIKLYMIKSLQLSFPVDDAVRILIVLLASMTDDDQDTVHASRFILNHIDHLTSVTNEEGNHATFWNERLFSRLLAFLFPTTTTAEFAQQHSKYDTFYLQSRNALKIEYVIHVLEYANQKFDKFYYQTENNNFLPVDHWMLIWKELIALESSTSTGGSSTPTTAAAMKNIYLTYHNSLLYPKVYSNFLELFVKLFRPDHHHDNVTATSGSNTAVSTSITSSSMHLSSLKQHKRIGKWLSSSGLVELLENIDSTISHFAATATNKSAQNHQHHTSASVNYIMKFKSTVLEILDLLVASKYSLSIIPSSHEMQTDEIASNVAESTITVGSILLSSHMSMISKLFSLALYDSHCHTSTSPLFHILHQLQYAVLSSPTFSSAFFQHNESSNLQPNTEFLTLMDTLLDDCATSDLSSCRLLYIPWSNGLFPFAQKMFIQLTLLTDDSIDMVRNTAIKQFDALKNQIMSFSLKSASYDILRKKFLSIGKNIIEAIHVLTRATGVEELKRFTKYDSRKGIPHLLQLFDIVLAQYTKVAGTNYMNHPLSDHYYYPSVGQNPQSEIFKEDEKDLLLIFQRCLEYTSLLSKNDYDFATHPHAHLWYPPYYATMSSQNINTFITEYGYYLYDGYSTFVTNNSDYPESSLPAEVAQNNIYLIIMSSMKLRSLLDKNMNITTDTVPLGNYLYHKALRHAIVQIFKPNNAEIIQDETTAFLKKINDRESLLNLSTPEVFQALIGFQYLTSNSIYSVELIESSIEWISSNSDLLSFVSSGEVQQGSKGAELNYWTRMIISDALDYLGNYLEHTNRGVDETVWLPYYHRLHSSLFQPFLPQCLPPVIAPSIANNSATTTADNKHHWIGNKFLLNGILKLFVRFSSAKVIPTLDMLESVLFNSTLLEMVQDKPSAIKNDDRILSVFSLAESIIYLCASTPSTNTSGSLPALIENFQALRMLDRMESAIFFEESPVEAEAKPSKFLLFHTTLAVLFIHTLYQSATKQKTHSLKLSFHLINRLLRLLLASLKFKENALLQDLSVRGLSFLYYLCCSTPTNSHSSKEHLNGGGVRVEIENLVEGLAKYATIGQYIADEIATTVSRKKRSQPSNNASTTTNAGNTAAAINGILRDIPIPVGTGAGGNDQTDNDEVLQAATAMAMAEVQRAVGGNQNNGPNAAGNNSVTAGDFEVSETGYGVYSKVCQIFRKCGDGTILIVALSLVRNDLTFGQTPGYTYLLDRIFYPLPDIIPLSKAQISSLIPMLYVSKFDPMTSVRELMIGVWDKLFMSAVTLEAGGESKSSLENDYIGSNQKAIMQYIVNSGLLHPTWREREACCLALEALLLSSSIQWETINSVFDTLLVKGLKVIDDIRESTRLSAMKMMKILINQHILRACNQHETNAAIASATLAQLLPILINKGMVSASMEAKGFSLGTILKLIKDGDKITVVPYLDQIIDLFIESMSALEPQMLPYLSFHTTSLQMSKEEWEEARLKLTSSSPMHEALTQCLQLLPIDMVGKVCGIAYHQIVFGVGLPTRVTAANVFTYIAEKFPSASSSSFSGNHLKQLQAFQALVKILCDAPYLEASLKKALIHAMGMTAKTIDASLLAEECELLIQRYNNTFFGVSLSLTTSYYDTDVDFAMAHCFLQILKKAGDRLVLSTGTVTKNGEVHDSSKDDFWTEILAISYIGSMDQEEHPDSAKAWSDCFHTAIDVSGIGDKPSAIIRCLPALLTKKIPYLLLQDSWLRRKLGCTILIELVNQYLRMDDLNATANSKASMFSSAVGMSLFALLLEIPGLVWNGQYLIFDVFSALFTKLMKASSTSRISFAQDSDIVLRCQGENEDKSRSSDSLFCRELSLHLLTLGHFMNRSSGVESSSMVTTLEEMSIDPIQSAGKNETTSSGTNDDSPSAIGYEQVKREKEAILQTLSNISPTTRITWEINVHAFLPVLFKELSRGDETYKISVANTIAQLPWEAMMMTLPTQPHDLQQNYFLQYYGNMLQMVGFHTSLPSGESSNDMMIVEEKKVVSPSTSSTNNSSSSMPKEKRQKLSSASALFGNRYGALPTKPVTSALRIRPPPAPTNTTTSSSTSPASNNTSSASSATNGVTNLVITSSLAPAVRKYLLQAISNGWQEQLIKDGASSTSLVLSIKAILLSLLAMIHQDVWSIRQSSFDYLGNIAARTVLASEHVGIIVQCIEKGILEPKYVQIKQAALQALEKLLVNGNNKPVISQEFLPRIRKIISTVSTDTQGSMLEMASKLQTLMLKY